MTDSNRLFTRLMLTLSVCLAVGAAGLVIAGQARAADPQASTDQFRTGGCSGCFTTQMNAVTANFFHISRVFRGCATGTGVSTTDAGCAGAALQNGVSLIQDFVVIQGDLRCSQAPCNGGLPLDANGLGVPHGQLNVTYRVSANGSSRGLNCANGGTDPNSNSTGFLSPEGMDGIPGTSDDAGVGPGFGVIGVPAGWPSTAARTRDALVDCTGKTAIASYFPAGIVPDTTGMQELCVVQYNQNADSDIDNKADGVIPASYGSIAAAAASNESTNTRLTCDTGFADLPPADFESPSFNTQTFSNQTTTGAQIFKIIAHKSVYTQAHPGPGGTQKINLQMPQVEALFGATGLGVDACSWKAVGGAVNGDTDNKIKVCFREDGSGTRETFRNTFMLTPQGQHPMGTTVGSFSCTARDESPGTSTTVSKSFQVNTTGGDESACVAGTIGAVGYVNASRTNANYYSPVVFGVDPQTADLRNLVKCGQYPYWGPLTGGTGIHSAFLLTNVYVAAHLQSLKDSFVFSTGSDYLPLGGLQTGVAFDKALTASYYNAKYTANGTCTGEVPGPATHP
ncbi:MAG TPA: hypothetical protein VMS55_02410 [Myxococcota bacterium]|nr:hypothetical protein [Myxococcota bacterium]